MANNIKLAHYNQILQNLQTERSGRIKQATESMVFPQTPVRWTWIGLLPFKLTFPNILSKRIETNDL